MSKMSSRLSYLGRDVEERMEMKVEINTIDLPLQSPIADTDYIRALVAKESGSFPLFLRKKLQHCTALYHHTTANMTVTLSQTILFPFRVVESLLVEVLHATGGVRIKLAIKGKSYALRLVPFPSHNAISSEI